MVHLGLEQPLLGCAAVDSQQNTSNLEQKHSASSSSSVAQLKEVFCSVRYRPLPLPWSRLTLSIHVGRTQRITQLEERLCLVVMIHLPASAIIIPKLSAAAGVMTAVLQQES